MKVCQKAVYPLLEMLTNSKARKSILAIMAAKPSLLNRRSATYLFFSPWLTISIVRTTDVFLSELVFSVLFILFPIFSYHLKGKHI